MPKKSDVWQHFTRDTDEHGNVINKARCNYCTDRKEFQTKDGTANLWKHFRKFHLPPQPSAPSGSNGASTDHEPMQALPCALSQEPCLEGQRLWEYLARMITLHGYESSFVEDDYFRSFVKSLNPEFEVPSRSAIEEMCDGIFDEARMDLLSRLRNAPARVTVVVGKAKNIEAEEVLYTACHFIDDEWNLRKLVLQAALDEGAVGGYQNGPILGVDVVSDVDNVYERHGIQDRLSIVAYDESFDPDELNYIMDEINCHTNLFVDNVLHKIAGCFLPYADFQSKEPNAAVDLTRQTRQQLLSHCDLDNPWTYHEYHESWYSWYCSIKVTLHKKGYSSVYVNFASLLCKVWGTIHQAIQRLFSSTSNMCLRELFNVREVLQSEAELYKVSDDYIEEEYGCLVQASNTLDKAIQDSYLIWSVSFVLDPRYKHELLKFCFERAFGSEEAAKYVSEVMTRINELYDYYIKQHGRVTGANNNNAIMATTSADLLEQAWNEHRRQQDVIMVDQVNCTYPETQKELSRYLEDPLVPSTQDFDILDWWRLQSSKYPTIALMARDALAMPARSKLSSDQIAQVRSMIRGYSKETYAKKFC